MNERPIRWFYFNWRSIAGKAMEGCQVIPMTTDFDFALAHRWIEKEHGVAGMITFFAEITIEQVAGFKLYTDAYHAKQSSTPCKLAPVIPMLKSSTPPDESI